MASIGTLAVNLTARTQPLEAGLKKARGKFGKFEAALKKMTGGINRIQGGLVSAFAAGGPVAAAIGATTAGIAALGAALGRETERLDALAKAAARIGTSVENLQGLQFGAGLAGVDPDKITRGIEKLMIATQRAAQEGGKLQEAFAGAGINVERLAKLNTGQQIAAMAEAFKNLDEASSQLLLNRLSIRNTELLNFLRQGGDAIQGLVAEGRSFGVVTGEAAAAAERYQDALSRTQAAFTGSKNALLNTFSPVMDALAEKAETFAKFIAVAVDGLQKMAALLKLARGAFPKLGKGLERFLGGLAPFGGISAAKGAAGAASAGLSKEIDRLFNRLIDEQKAGNQLSSDLLREIQEQAGGPAFQPVDVR